VVASARQRLSSSHTPTRSVGSGRNRLLTPPRPRRGVARVARPIQCSLRTRCDPATDSLEFSLHLPQSSAMPLAPSRCSVAWVSPQEPVCTICSDAHGFWSVWPAAQPFWPTSSWRPRWRLADGGALGSGHPPVGHGRPDTLKALRRAWRAGHGTSPTGWGSGPRSGETRRRALGLAQRFT
jgi:hypothetical protein